jgi:hypothetical protein
MHALTPTVLYVPATQSMHAPDVVAATTVEYVPASQSMQSPSTLYVPAAQSEQLV